MAGPSIIRTFIGRIRQNNQRMRRWQRIVLVTNSSIVGLVIVIALIASLMLHGSLPKLDGERKLAGISAPVTVTRDSLGVPDIQAQNRLDAALALGYLHAQDRFFQMDLQRRAAAGELAALLGSNLLETDRDVRRHRFRNVAQDVVKNLSAEHREILTVYTAGVNSGLYDLTARPFEYLLLRCTPEPWQLDDSILTLLAMFLDLSLSSANNEEVWAVVRDNLPQELTNFLLPRSGLTNAPLQTATVPGISIPDSTKIDIRRWTYDGQTYEQYRDHHNGPTRHDTAGSNNWAVAGTLTGHGGAIVANDMHLAHGLPNIWYRAKMSWPEGKHRRTLVGLTLPGIPAQVTGSNGQVAWGFTNTSGDWADLVILETDPNRPQHYLTPDGWLAFLRIPEVIEVAGSENDTLWVDQTIWGPVWTKDTKGRSLALRWTAHDVDAVNIDLINMETTVDVEAVLAIGGTFGIPAQNLVCADTQGRIAWTLAGRIPRRTGWDGRLPVSWADGSCYWDGYLDPDEQPQILDPAEGRLWTANNRVTAGHDLQVIGDGGYALGARARQIRDGLRAMDRPLEQDLLALQLDDRAIMLERWRNLALKVLQPEVEALQKLAADGEQLTRRDSLRIQFHQTVQNEWSGRANVESISYRLVRNFAYECIDGIYDVLTMNCTKVEPDFRSSWLPYRHDITWEIIQQRPANLLTPHCYGWDEFVLRSADYSIVVATKDGNQLENYTWGARNKVDVAHPLTRAVPMLAKWLAAPTRPQPGDSFMPRVQHRRSGASERMVVSPGREQDGILHMPGGQSGHPLSPYFLAGHEDWVTGKPTPLLPSDEVHRLILVPTSNTR